MITINYTDKKKDLLVTAKELVKGDKGDPGYTPIKGVDYFDGKDGAPGRDGKDGYTPIKGVDYFDGEPGPMGPEGKPGKDGTMSFSDLTEEQKESWRGEPGPAGEDGKDYVLTEADKAEIAGMVEVDAPDVDLTGYYTKDEIDALLANLPSGESLPAAEEVEF